MASIDFASLDLPSLALAAGISAQRDFDSWVAALTVSARVGLEFSGIRSDAAHHRAQANDAALNAQVLGFVALHWAVLEPVFLALAQGDSVETVEVAPQRKEERPPLLRVAS